jgi:dTDP-4-amino-4,6-dideoxygalactose transaminase
MVEVSIPFNRPFVPQNSSEYVLKSLGSAHLSGDGPYTKIASQNLSKISSESRVLLTTSCTHALELACLALQLDAGDEVIIPSYNFTSAAIAILSAGAVPVFVDVRDDTKNLDENLLEIALSSRTRAIIPVHYAGVGAEMSVIMNFAQKNGLSVIEDNAHGLGGTYQGKKLGSFGAMSTLSFHETKNLQCGEGGALEINTESLLERIEVMREKGTNRSKFFRGQVDKYQWTDIGSSWLPSDILAALLVGQTEKFEFIQKERHAIWQSYQSALIDWSRSNGFELPFIPPGESHTAHMFYMVSPDLETRTQFIEHMRSRSISTPFHYQSLHSSTAGQRYGRQATEMPISDKLSDQLVRLPMWIGLEKMQIDYIVESITSFR